MADIEIKLPEGAGPSRNEMEVLHRIIRSGAVLEAIREARVYYEQETGMEPTAVLVGDEAYRDLVAWARNTHRLMGQELGETGVVEIYGLRVRRFKPTDVVIASEEIAVATDHGIARVIV